MSNNTTQTTRFSHNGWLVEAVAPAFGEAFEYVHISNGDRAVVFCAGQERHFAPGEGAVSAIPFDGCPLTRALHFAARA